MNASDRRLSSLHHRLVDLTDQLVNGPVRSQAEGDALRRRIQTTLRQITAAQVSRAFAKGRA